MACRRTLFFHIWVSAPHNSLSASAHPCLLSNMISQHLAIHVLKLHTATSSDVTLDVPRVTRMSCVLSLLNFLVQAVRLSALNSRCRNGVEFINSFLEDQTRVCLFISCDLDATDQSACNLVSFLIVAVLTSTKRYHQRSQTTAMH